MRLGRVDVPDHIACLVRQAVIEIGGFDWVVMGIVSAESGFDPNAVGDAGCSIGLLQLNTCGGQGNDYRNNKDALKDPKLNLQVGVPPIAVATLQATQRGYTGERFIKEIARSSGHPGFVPLDDPRLEHIYDDTVRLITDNRGNLVKWPVHDPRRCSGAIAPPPPIGSWTEGPTPRTVAEADAAIVRHANRVGELMEAF